MTTSMTRASRPGKLCWMERPAASSEWQWGGCDLSETFSAFFFFFFFGSQEGKGCPEVGVVPGTRTLSEQFSDSVHLSEYVQSHSAHWWSYLLV